MPLSLWRRTNTKFDIELDPALDIGAVKAALSTSQGTPIDTMVLVHKGKVLADDTTLTIAGVTEASFVVVMQQKAKAGDSFRLSIRPTVNRRAESARLYERSP